MPFVRWFRVHFGSLKLNTMCALRVEFYLNVLLIVSFWSILYIFISSLSHIEFLRFALFHHFFLSFFLNPFFASSLFLDTWKWISINVFAFMSFLHRPYSALPSVYTSKLGKCNIHIAFTSSELRTVFNLYACNCNKRIECILNTAHISPQVRSFLADGLFFSFFASPICV